MTQDHPDLAFIGTKGTFFQTSTNARICARARRRNRSVRHWRCVVQDGSAEKSTDVSQLEGAVPFDKFDAGLEAALSKGWDKLENFDGVMGEEEQSPSAIEDDADEDKDISAETSNVLDSDSDSSSADESTSPVSAGATMDVDGVSPVVDEKKPKAKRKRKTTKPKEPKPTMTGMELKDSAVWPTEPRWYFVQVRPGCEQSTAVSIRNLSTSLESSEIREVLVPTTTIMRLTKGGKSVKKEERFFPSYILVLMTMNRRNYSKLLAVPNVQFFMGDPNRDKKKDAPLLPPLPVKDAEMKNVFMKIAEANSAKPEIKTKIRPGDSIKVISGSFVENLGRVLEVKPDLNVVKANLFIFGRETAVDLEFGQVEVIDDIMNVREPENDEKADSSETVTKRRGRGKSLPAGARQNAGVASAEDDLAALLEDSGDESLESNDDTDADGSNIDLAVADDDGFGEAEITDSGEDDGFESAESLDDESEGEATKAPVVRKSSGLISSDEELADLLSDDYSESSDLKSDGDDAKGDDLDDLDAFFSSLEELDDDDESGKNATPITDDAKSSTDEGISSEKDESEISDQQVMERMKAAFDGGEIEDDLGFGAEAMLQDVDKMMADVAAGKRKVGPSEEDHDLSEPIITTDEEMEEMDLFGVPDMEGVTDPDVTAPPSPLRKSK